MVELIKMIDYSHQGGKDSHKNDQFARQDGANLMEILIIKQIPHFFLDTLYIQAYSFAKRHCHFLSCLSKLARHLENITTLS